MNLENTYEIPRILSKSAPGERFTKNPRNFLSSLFPNFILKFFLIKSAS